MSDWPCHVWLQKKGRKIVWPTNKAALEVFYQHLYISLGDGVVGSLSPNHSIHGENDVHQQWTMYLLKSKSVSKMYSPMIWRSKFTDLVNREKTQSLGKSGCRQKCLEKSLVENGLDRIQNWAILQVSKVYKNDTKLDVSIAEKERVLHSVSVSWCLTR